MIDQEGNPQGFLAHYWRHHHEYRDECDSAEDAMYQLHYGAEDGNMAACCVIDPDGRSREVEVVYGLKREDGTWAPDVITLSAIVECPAKARAR